MVVGGGQVGIYGLSSGEASFDGVQRAVADSSVFGSATSGAVVVNVSGSSDVGIFGSATTGPVLNASVSSSSNVDIFGSASPGTITVLASQNIDIFGSASSATTISVSGSSVVNIFSGRGDALTLQNVTQTRVEGGVFGSASGPGISVSVGGGSSNVGIFGTSAADSVQVGTGSYIGIDLRGGSDTIEVDGTQHLVAITDAGEDSFTIRSGFDILAYLGAGVDRAHVLGGEFVRVIGEEDNDEILLSSGSNITVDGGEGNDKLFFTGGHGINVRGDAGDDQVDIYGGIGLSVVGGSGNDRLRIFGSLGGTLDAGKVYALLDGQDGNDALEVRPLLGLQDRGLVETVSVEFPHLYAPSWMALPAWIAAPSTTTFASSIAVVGGLGNNTIWLEGAQRLYGIGGDEVDTITLQSGGSSEIAGGRASDNITVRAAGSDNRVFGDQGDDIINAYAGTRLGIFGEEGADTIRFHDGQDGFARGGDANDILEILNGSRLVLAGELGDDSLTIAGGTSGVAAGGVGEDTLEITGGSLGLLLGQSGSDHLKATGGTQSIVSGGDGDDRIDAANRGDDLYGDDGDDEYRILTTTSASQLLRLRELLYVDPVDFEPEARGSDTIDLSAFATSAALNLSTIGVFNSQTLGLQSSIPGQLQIILLGSLENIVGTTASDVLTGNSESNRIVGLGGNDTILGLSGDDTIEGGAGDDILDGGNGDDVYLFTTAGVSLGSDTLYEATDNGIDGLDFSGMPVGLGTLNLALATSQELNGGLLSLTLRQSGSNPTVADVEEVIGTDFDDIILGNILDNRIEPKRGNDTVDGRAGSDIYVFAGRGLGSDQVIDESAGAGRDTLDFVGFDAPVVLDLTLTTAQPLGEMTLTLSAGDSIENVLGSSYDDTIRGNARDNTIYGAAGKDWLEGRSGNDKLVADLPSVVLLDFDSAYNAARGDYNYSVAERNLIQQKLTTTYAAFNWSFTQSESEARGLTADMGRSFVRLAIGQGRGGGILGDAGEVDFRNIRRRVVTEVNINPMLPTVRQLLTEQLGTTSYTPQQYSDMVVAFTATIAGHELAHTAGLRHGDAFGPIGSGLYAGTDTSNIYPVDPRPANGAETGWHMLSSPASTGTPLSDAAKTTFFGEREAIKMAFNETGRTRRETEAESGSNDAWMLAEPLDPDATLPSTTPAPLSRLYVPNMSPASGFIRSGQSFDVSAMAIVGDIDGATDRDFYRFTAQAGDTINIELMVSSIRPLRGDPFDGEIRLYDANGIEIAFNDDDFEGTKDATLLDFVITASGTYFVSVGLSEQPVFGTGGRYELFVSRFRVGVAANVEGDSLMGGAGNDVIVGGAANDLILGGGALPGDLDSIDGMGGYDTVDGQGLAYNYTVVGAPIENVIATVNTPPSVIIQGPVDGLLNEEQSFTFHAVDLDAVDANGPFEFTITWGDGTQTMVTSLVGQSTVTVTKTYTAVSSSGVFVITAKAKDVRNLTGPEATRTFAATGWTIMADPANPGKNMLVVVGSQGNDAIRIKERNGDYLKVRIHEREDNVRVKGIVSGDVDRILVFGLDGNDRITIDDDIDTNAEVWGGKGKDEIKGGGGHDILLGGAGDDKIYGGEGRDFIIGGTGADRLYGDALDDILVAGFTAYDEEFNASAPSDFAASARLAFDVQRQALEAILAEWTSCRSYTTRRNNLLGTGSGTRFNGDYFLKATGSTATSNSVFDDGAKDQLWGESGTDWFFANLDGDNQSAKDEVKDRSGSETITDTDRWW
jgi:Ca2+-binding RTX toxin-like protein